MSKIAVIYWSMSGNTEAMANAIAEGAERAGAEVDVKQVSEITVDQALEYDKLALGLKENSQEVVYDEAVSESITSTQSQNAHNTASEKDSYFAEAGRFIIEKEKGSIGMLQRYYKIGFNRAARIMDQLADAGVVGPEVGTKPRKVLMTPEEFETYLKQNT